MKETISEAERIRIAVAFFSTEGLRSIEEAVLKRLEHGAASEFLIGLDFSATDVEVLRRLLALSKQYERMSLWCFKSTRVYHPKMYIIDTPSLTHIILGSSNLTAGGLTSNIEANLHIVAEADEEIVSDAEDAFLLIKNAQGRFMPDSEYIELYATAQKTAQKIRDYISSSEEARTVIEAVKRKEETLVKPTTTPEQLSGWLKLVWQKIPLGKFPTSYMYRFVDEFRRRYPANRNIEAKIRQKLQDLCRLGLINDAGRGFWIRER